MERNPAAALLILLVSCQGPPDASGAVVKQRYLKRATQSIPLTVSRNVDRSRWDRRGRHSTQATEKQYQDEQSTPISRADHPRKRRPGRRPFSVNTTSDIFIATCRGKPNKCVLYHTPCPSTPHALYKSPQAMGDAAPTDHPPRERIHQKPESQGALWLSPRVPSSSFWFPPGGKGLTSSTVRGSSFHSSLQRQGTTPVSPIPGIYHVRCVSTPPLRRERTTVPRSIRPARREWNPHAFIPPCRDSNRNEVYLESRFLAFSMQSMEASILLRYRYESLRNGKRKK